VFSYRSEDGAWLELGVAEPPFTLDEFLRVTGRMKKTRKTRRGRITDVHITVWEEWNETPRTGSGRVSNPTSKGVSVRQNRASEIDSDIEIEIDRSNPFTHFLEGKTP
jgi:hypothetical protein